VRDWTDFGVREGMSISARSPVRGVPEVAQIFSAVLAETDAALAEPFRGVTTDGVVRGRNPLRTGMVLPA
jgi:adenosine/AMP kinase